MASKMPSHNGPPKDSTSKEVPSQTLYVKNLPEKMHKPELRMSLYMLFSTYGPVLDVVALKAKHMRGQAHVVYRDTQTSTSAMRALQGFEFFGKELIIQYAKGRSDVFTKLEGVYRAPTVTTEPTAEQSIFTAPTGTSTTAAAAAPSTNAPDQNSVTNGTTPEAAQGTKRAREEESDEDKAPVEEDEDDDVSMEASSDEE